MNTFLDSFASWLLGAIAQPMAANIVFPTLVILLIPISASWSFAARYVIMIIGVFPSTLMARSIHLDAFTDWSALRPKSQHLSATPLMDQETFVGLYVGPCPAKEYAVPLRCR